MPNGCRIYKTTNLILPPGVQTPIDFNAERYDDAGYHDTLVNPTRITIPETGRYHVFASILLNLNRYAFAQVFVRRNNSIAIVMDKREIDPGNSAISLSTIYEFTAGDFIELLVWHNMSLTNVLLVAAPNYSPEFGVEKIN
jgi:hypothetical protein